MPEKIEIKTNESEDYQETWEDYIEENKFSPTILLPLELGINAKGELYRNRMKAGDIAEIWKGIKGKFPSYMQKAPAMFDNPAQVFGEYISYYDGIDDKDHDAPRTPLDLNITHPTWIMFSLDNANWKFPEHGAKFSTENDPDDLTCNYVQIAMFDDPRLPAKPLPGYPKDSPPMNARKLLILANRNRSNPEGLKYNLHVDVLQMLFGKLNSTMIIIDPGGDNRPKKPWD